MRYFLGLHPPTSLSDSVLAFRKECNTSGMMPHITIKAPCGLGPDQTWLPLVVQICRSHPALTVRVEGVSCFGDSTLFLRVISPDLINFHNQIVRELDISFADQVACFEGPQYSPHLTLMQTRSSAEEIISESIVASAIERFTEPFEFRAKTLAVYRKPPRGEYHLLTEISFQ